MPTNTAATSARHYQTHQMHYLYVDITFSDNGVVKELGYVPAGAYVVRGGAVVTTAFNAGTGNVLDIGTSGDDDGFATDLALGTIGVIAADEMATTNDAYVTTDTRITCTPALSGTAATAGAARVWVEYMAP